MKMPTPLKISGGTSAELIHVVRGEDRHPLDAHALEKSSKGKNQAPTDAIRELSSERSDDERRGGPRQETQAVSIGE